jgi:hypothetical protein
MDFQYSSLLDHVNQLCRWLVNPDNEQLAYSKSIETLVDFELYRDNNNNNVEETGERPDQYTGWDSLLSDGRTVSPGQW